MAHLLEMGTLISCRSFDLPVGAVSHNLLPMIMLWRVKRHENYENIRPQSHCLLVICTKRKESKERKFVSWKTKMTHGSHIFYQNFLSLKR